MLIKNIVLLGIPLKLNLTRGKSGLSPRLAIRLLYSVGEQRIITHHIGAVFFQLSREQGVAEHWRCVCPDVFRVGPGGDRIVQLDRRELQSILVVCLSRCIPCRAR